jgi:hypothetical protein
MKIQKKVSREALLASLILICSSCSGLIPCPTYNHTGISNDIMKAKTVSRHHMEERYFSKYNRNKGHLRVIMR